VDARATGPIGASPPAIPWSSSCVTRWRRGPRPLANAPGIGPLRLDCRRSSRVAGAANPDHPDNSLVGRDARRPSAPAAPAGAPGPGARRGRGRRRAGRSASSWSLRGRRRGAVLPSPANGEAGSGCGPRLPRKIGAKGRHASGAGGRAVWADVSAEARSRRMRDLVRKRWARRRRP
jgi:hypothetical protein